MAHSIKVDNGKETKYKSRPDINARSEEVKVRPDWNQIDPNAPDYIKNKTHGPGYINEIDNPCELNIEVMLGGNYTVMSSDGGSFPESEKYALMSATCHKFDGESNSTSSMMDITECPYFIVPAGVISDEETYGYGNPFLYGCGEDNGLAIAVVKNSSNSGLGCSVKIKDISSFYGTEENGYIIVCIGTNYKFGDLTLDEKYIPDSIARKSDISDYAHSLDYDYSKRINIDSETNEITIVSNYEYGDLPISDLCISVACKVSSPSDIKLSIKLSYYTSNESQQTNITRTKTIGTITESNTWLVWDGYLYKNKFGQLQIDHISSILPANTSNSAIINMEDVPIKRDIYGKGNKSSIPEKFVCVTEIKITTDGASFTSGRIDVVGKEMR